MIKQHGCHHVLLVACAAALGAAQPVSGQALAADAEPAGVEADLSTLEALEQAEARFSALYSTDKPAALVLIERIIPARIARSGAGAADTIEALEARAALLDDLGRAAEAAPLYREVLAARRRNAGDEAPRTLMTWHNTAFVLARAGQRDAAIAHYRDVLRIRTATLGEAADDTVVTRGELARLLTASGQYPEALALLEDNVRHQSSRHKADSDEVFRALSAHADALDTAGKPQLAEPIYRNVYERYRETKGAEDPATLNAMHNLAYILETLNRSLEAEVVHAGLEALRRKIYGTDDPRTIQTIGNHTTTLVSLRRFADADKLLQELIALRTARFGQDDPATTAAVRNRMMVLAEMGRLDEGRAIGEALLTRQHRAIGEADPATLTTLYAIAAMYRRAGDYSAAEPLYRQTLTLRSKVLGERDPDTIWAMASLGSTLETLGRFDEAEPLLRRTWQLRREVLGETHPDTLAALGNHASVLDSQGRTDEARDSYALALRLRRDNFGPRDPGTLTAMHNYAYSLEISGRLEDARKLYTETMNLRSEVLGDTHPDTLTTFNNLAQIYESLGHHKEAAELFETVVLARRKFLGERHSDTLSSINNLAGVYDELDRVDEAAALYESVLASRIETQGARHPDTVNARVNLGYIRGRQGRRAESEPIYAEALAIALASFGPRHPSTLTAAGNLARVRLRMAGHEADAMVPARLLIDAARSNALAGQEAVEAEAAKADKEAGMAFRLFADAAWANRHVPRDGRRGSDPLEAEVFAGLQDSLVSSTSRALARNAALQAGKRAGLGAITQERDVLVEQRRTLDAALIATYLEKSDDSARKTTEQQLRAADSRLAAIDAEIERKAPDLFSLIHPRAVSLDAARNLLRDDEAALTLVPTEHGVHIMALTRDGLTWHRSAITSAVLARHVRRLLWDVGADVEVSQGEAAEWGAEGAGALPYDFETANALYRALIAPVEPALAGRKHLFVSAAGVLSRLPLGILASEVPAGANGDPAVQRSAKWMADRYAISVLPSLQALQFLRQFRVGDGAAQPPFLGFGDPALDGIAQQRGGRGKAVGSASEGGFARFFGATRSGGAGMASPAELRKLARLPETRVEIERQWLAFGKPEHAVFLGAEATERQVKQIPLAAGVLSFATHGLLAGELKGNAEPGLVLTPPDVPSELDDGLLTASEIAGLKVSADWVILSACNTAAGDGSDGAAGLSGLARSFFFAGARNLLVSHWPVRDDVAAQLTVRAIEMARDNPDLARSTALQRAMAEIRRNPSHDTDADTWAHPSAWAPFSMVGDGALTQMDAAGSVRR
ncbi:MAG: tetratricopeptide repeat protein [Novosphingobium sp.]|uniref:tetratricopeptide repeat protein n=1 Tax=Novosphingobium sp. TaxID=1874826 RepID=UPI003B9CCF6F